jgi:multidrug efflux pump subunit AcrA (membrane-fusion protein)
MYVNVAFATIGGAENTVPVVPAVAVQNINNQQTVFVATNDPNVFVLRPVRLGPESNGFYPVLEGLAVGDRVVTEGSFLLRAEWLKTNPSKVR